MTDKKKISILERLLDERDKQIQELQEQNAKLEKELENYKSADNEMKELQELIQKGREMTVRLGEMSGEYDQMKKDFRRDMMKLFKRQRKF